MMFEERSDSSWVHRVVTDPACRCVQCGKTLLSGARVLRFENGTEMCRSDGKRYAALVRAEDAGPFYVCR
jgi:hypothetical protein